MKSQRGFTMVELMIVIVIVAILASVAVPLMRGRIDRAKYSEGMAGCSAIATALTSYAAENPDKNAALASLDPILNLGFKENDLAGNYFDHTSYSITSGSYVASDGSLSFTITATPTDTTLTEVLTLTRDTTGDTEFSYSSGTTVGGN